MKPCKTDMEKTRAIFVWYCAQDFSDLPSVSSTEGGDKTMAEILGEMQADHVTYPEVFHDICKCAGLRSYHVLGIVKDSEYDVGDEVVNTKRTVGWNAIKTDTEWRLVDISRAVRKLTSGNNSKWELIDDNGKGYTKVDNAPSKLVRDMDERYFLKDPEQMIYKNFPHDEKWQLLARPVTAEEFMNMALVEASFFELGLMLREAKHTLIESSTTDSVIKIGVPKDKARRFMYRFWKSSADMNVKTLTTDESLQQCVYLEQRTGVLLCKIFYPIPGTYKLQLFGKDTSDGQLDGMHSGCVEYLLKCTNENINFTSIPENSRHEWGPGQDSENLGLVPVNYPSGMIESNDGFVVIVFKATKTISINAALRCQNKSKEETTQWVTHSYENGNITIYLRIQKKGKYALDVFGKPHGRDGGLPNVCTYLICAASGVFDELLFPPTTNQRIGPTSASSEYNLNPVSHLDAYFTCVEGQANINLEYASSLKFMIKMHHMYNKDDPTKLEEKTEYTFLEQEQTDMVCFKARFPISGMYLIQIYAKKRDSEGPSYSNVYNYIVYAKYPMKHCRPFPKTYSAWTEGCKLNGINDGVIESGREIEVKAHIPKAVAVALINCLLGVNQFHHLTEVSGQWQGKITTGSAGSSLQLSAKFDEESSSYSALTEYQVKTEVDILEIEQQHNKHHEDTQKEQEEEEKRNQEESSEFQEIKKELQEAIVRQDMSKLKAAVKRVEEKHYITKLKTDYDKARNLINNLHKITRLDAIIQMIDAKTVAEIVRYNDPPQSVHRVVMATLLLMGVAEKKTEDWRFCQKTCTSVALRSLLQKLVVANLDPLTLARTLQLIQQYRVDDLATECLGAACLYTWTAGIARISLQFTKTAKI